MATRAAQLLAQSRVGALATLHDYAPSVSMAPFALVQGPFALVIQVSGLAAHTRDMLADPRVALLVAEPETADQPVHALARVSLAGEAHPLGDNDVHFVAARAAYAARFPEMMHLFELADFRLFAIHPKAVRVVAGFAQAHSLTPATLAAALAAQAAGR